MSYRNVFDLVSEEFGKANIPFVLAGGLAVNYHGVARNTGDVDFLIAEKDIEKASGILEKFGYRSFHENKLFERFENSDLRFMVVDLLLMDPKTLEGIISEGKKVKIIEHEFIIPSLNHLLAMKLHAMKQSPDMRFYKDLPDIVSLIQKNKIDVTSVSFRDLCLKFGTEDLHKELLHFLRKDSQ